jgi:NAD(P)H-quinone oxidoreductase subunit 6
MSAADVVFYLMALMTLASAGVVAFSRNIVHSAFALLGTFVGVAGLYAYLSADFLAVVQMLVYVGGILVVILFAVMLTGKIGEVRLTNRSAGVLAGATLLLAVLAGLTFVALQTPWDAAPAPPASSTTATLGNALLGQYVLPFEVASLLLVAVLVGAVALIRKEEP